MTDEVREALEWVESYEQHGDISMEELALGIGKLASDREKVGDNSWRAVREVAARMSAGDEAVDDWQPLLLELKAALSRIV